MVIMLQVLSVVFIVSLGVAVLPPLLTAMHERDPIFWQFFIVGTLIIMIVATITTVGAFLTARIGVFWRRDLTLSLMERYFKNKVLYGVNCMDRGTRLCVPVSLCLPSTNTTIRHRQY